MYLYKSDTYYQKELEKGRVNKDTDIALMIHSHLTLSINF